VRTGISGKAVAAGAVLALAVAIPVVAIVAVVDATVGIRCRSNGVVVPYLVILAGMVLGGRRAALRQMDSPLIHGALAALAAFVVVAVGNGLGRALSQPSSHCPRSALAPVFNALMSASAGIAGGFLAARRKST